MSRALTLYEADTNPRAHKGADLLNIGGKVTFIGVNSAQDGVTELGAIKRKTQVSALIDMVLQAYVDQSRSRQGQSGYFIALPARRRRRPARVLATIRRSAAGSPAATCVCRCYATGSGEIAHVLLTLAPSGACLLL
jgi:hypothetical protein